MQQDLNALNKQAIAAAREYTGEVAWPTVLLVVLVLAAFIANLALFANGLMPLWAAIPICAVLTYLSYTPLHEAAHGNIHGGQDRYQWLNDLCGYLVAPLISVPFSTHRVEHFTHHRYTNQPDKDPDFIVSGMRRGLLAFVVFGLRFLWVQNTFLFREYWATAPLRERMIYWTEVSVSIGWRVAFVLLVARESDLTMILAGYLIGAYFTVYWFAYRPHHPYEDATRYRNTNSLIMPKWMKPLEWFWLGQNLHSIHHLFPRVPFYRYHALHRRIEPVMRAHGTPIIGVFSRRER
ncbi:fatty acid desaturase [uncultured Nevskia sp.]|uniref:fatty acid desaturase family protein n=1 Tax=uncultured Nevskia sp. TaxID=228950 RepID=UPI0025D72411|nr:fatty acid desaturase [uncultured Nevskia sp.]